MPQPIRSTNMFKDAPPALFELSAEDVGRLMHRDVATEARLDVTERLAANYRDGAYNVREAFVAEQIFRLLARDHEARVRILLADYIKSSAHAPRDIVRIMADDIEEVALPVLRYSQVLTEADLLEIIRNARSSSRYIAIGTRETVSNTVSVALLNTSEPTVVTTLLRNAGAQMSEDTLQRIMESYGSELTVMSAMAYRPQLPPGVAERLIAKVPESLACRLQQQYAPGHSVLAEGGERRREDAMLQLAKKAAASLDVERLVDQLHMFDRLTPSLIMASLCEGNLRFVELAVARRANVSFANAHKLMWDGGMIGFRALYIRAGLPEPWFVAVAHVSKLVLRLRQEKRALIPGPAFAARLAGQLASDPLLRSDPYLPSMLELVRRCAIH